MKFEGGGEGLIRGARLLLDWLSLDDDHRGSIFSLHIIVFPVFFQLIQSRCFHHDHLCSRCNDDADGHHFNHLHLPDTISRRGSLDQRDNM